MKYQFMKLREAPAIPWNEVYPTFTRLAIETHSRCNRKCIFCPVATGRRDFAGRSMSDELYDKICEELSDAEWSGFVEFFVLNEPLLDKRLRQKASRLREATPKSTIYVSTNGDVLAKSRSPELLLESLYESGINSLNLNVYDSGELGDERLRFYRQLIDKATAMGLCEEANRKYSRRPPSKRVVHVSDMRLDRARAEFYDVFFDKTKESRGRCSDSYCARPHRNLVVLWDGKVPLCCAMDPTDPNGTFVGNVNDSSLAGVWKSEAIAKHRFFLQYRGGRSQLRQCRGCQHRMAYPHCVRLTSADKETSERWRHEEL